MMLILPLGILRQLEFTAILKVAHAFDAQAQYPNSRLSRVFGASALAAVNSLTLV